jgi:5'-nucleotidase
MRILISNDDGIQSPGLLQLAEVAREFGEVTVVAPHRERSTSGHSLTLHKPLRVIPHGPGFFAATGTPADCIYLGMWEVLKGKPDLILSGINAGANLGTDIHYSGTVAAAREGALMNIPSYAFSLVDSAHLPKATQESERGARPPLDFANAAEIARRVLRVTLGKRMPPHTLLNVNIPNRPIGTVDGIVVARQGYRRYSTEVSRRTDPRGRDYYWIGGAYVGFEADAASDCQALEAGRVAVTPLTIDCTHNEYYTTLRQLDLSGALAD